MRSCTHLTAQKKTKKLNNSCSWSKRFWLLKMEMACGVKNPSKTLTEKGLRKWINELYSP